MVQRIGGTRRKTRNLFKKKAREKGKVPIRNALQTFNKGDRVRLDAEPANQHGMYFRRFHQKTGIVVGEQGNCYQVEIKDGKRTKELIINPVHLKKL